MDRAKDVMTTQVVTVSPEMTVEQTIQTLLQHRISGAPVVGRQGELLGIISEYQLLEVIFTPELKSRSIDQFMTCEIVTAEEDTLVTEIATRFIVHRIRRLPVVRSGKVVGMISRRDLLRKASAATPGTAGPPLTSRP